MIMLWRGFVFLDGGTDANPGKAEEFDWSTPLAAPKEPTLDLDWSQPVMNKQEDALVLKWSDDENSDSEGSDSGLTMKNSIEEKSPVETEKVQREALEQEAGGLDIMAQQLKFIACLKILMAEMATLATGFEVDGGQLRLQLYLWLDRELQVLLTTLEDS